MPAITVADRNLHYLDEGVGDDTIVLLHGFPLDSGMWEPQMRDLADRYRLIAPDLMGFGASDAPDDPQSYSVERWADDVIGLIGGLGLDRVAVVGSSLGGDVALAVARRARELVGALALAGVRQGPPSADDDARWGEQQRWIATGGELGSIQDRLIDDLVGRDATRRPEVVKLARLMMDRTPRSGWVGGFDALRRRPDPAPDLDKLDVPAMVLAGEHDTTAPVEEVQALADRIPGAGLVVVPDAGHLPDLENPVAFNRALVDLTEGRLARRPSGKHGWPASPSGTRTG